MAKIIQQQQNLCSLFCLANIFKPDIDIQELQHIITTFKLDIKDGLTPPQENKVLSYFLTDEYQIVPWFLDGDNELSFLRLQEYLRIPYDDYLLLPILVKIPTIKNYLLHRIWVIKKHQEEKLIVLDTRYSYTKQYQSIVHFRNDYAVHGLSCIQSVPSGDDVMIPSQHFNHLID